MQALSNGRVRRSRAEWQEIVSRSKESDLSESEFCKHEGILYSTFAAWKRKLRLPPEAKGAFVEMIRSPVSLDAQPCVGGEFELSLPGGVTLRWKA